MKSPPEFQRQWLRLTYPFNERMRKVEKEENTVKQIYSAIQIEGYKGTYSGVRTFVQNIRKDRKHNISKRKGFIHLKEKFVCLVVEATPKIKKRRNRVTAVYTKRLFHFRGCISNNPEISGCGWSAWCRRFSSMAQRPVKQPETTFLLLRFPSAEWHTGCKKRSNSAF